MAHPSLQRTFDKDDVTTELRDALAIVEELQPPDDLRLALFQTAANLLAQRAQVQQVGVDLSSMLTHGRQLGG